MFFVKNNKGLSKVAIVLIIVGVVIVVGGTVAGIIAYNSYKQTSQQQSENKNTTENTTNAKINEGATGNSTENSTQQTIVGGAGLDQNEISRSYNAWVSQILASVKMLNEDGTYSLDKNDDVQEMTNAINELNIVTNDINKNQYLTQEQKNMLNASVAGEISELNKQIKAVNEGKVVKNETAHPKPSLAE